MAEPTAKPAKKTRNREDSQQAILAAAVTEFSRRGFDGARMENIARISGYNKSLIYRYFEDKEGLFREALRNRFRRRDQLADAIPEKLSEVLVYWSEETNSDPDFMRLIIHEALANKGGEPFDADFRRGYYQKQIQALRALQQQGEVSNDFAAPYLFLALLSMVVFPSTFPQITRLITGQQNEAPEFRNAWRTLMAQFTERLRDSRGRESLPLS